MNVCERPWAGARQVHTCGKLGGILLLAGLSVAESAQSPPSSCSPSALSLQYSVPSSAWAGPDQLTPDKSPNPEHWSPNLPILLALNPQLCLPQDLCTCIQWLELPPGSLHSWLLLVLLLTCFNLQNAFLDHPFSSFSHSVSLHYFSSQYLVWNYSIDLPVYFLFLPYSFMKTGSCLICPLLYPQCLESTQ